MPEIQTTVIDPLKIYGNGQSTAFFFFNEPWLLSGLSVMVDMRAFRFPFHPSSSQT